MIPRWFPFSLFFSSSFPRALLIFFHRKDHWSRVSPRIIQNDTSYTSFSRSNPLSRTRPQLCRLNRLIVRWCILYLFTGMRAKRETGVWPRVYVEPHAAVTRRFCRLRMKIQVLTRKISARKTSLRRETIVRTIHEWSPTVPSFLAPIIASSSSRSAIPVALSLFFSLASHWYFRARYHFIIWRIYGAAGHANIISIDEEKGWATLSYVENIMCGHIGFHRDAGRRRRRDSCGRAERSSRSLPRAANGN